MLALWLPASGASAAYREAHATGYDMHARIDDAGVAQFEHAITYRVIAGSLSSIELDGIDPTAVLESQQATITAEDGHTMPGLVTLQPPSGDAKDASIRVDVMEKRGLRRGVYVIKLRYHVDLVATNAITKDLALWRISWTSPSLPEGIDGERVVFDLPAAPTEPRAWRPDAPGAAAGAPAGDGIVSTLRRSADRDELEIVRLHVARGERVTWGARVDPKAFPAARSTELRPPSTPAAPVSDHLHESARVAFVALVALAFAFVFAKKAERTSELFAREQTIERPLLPLSRALRTVAAGVFMAACVATQLGGYATWGGIFLACSIFAIAYRAPRVTLRPRGPGSWSMVREREAFAAASRAGDVFDGSTRKGRITFAMALALVGGGVVLVDRFAGRAASYTVMLDALVLVPLFFTGTRAQLPPPVPQASAAWLKSLFGAMKKHALKAASDGFRIVPWARHPLGSEIHDELRLLVLPRTSMPGVIGIEIGATWPCAGDGPYLAPEVLVRVHDASAAAARLVTLAPEVRPLPGRKLHERVVRLTPEIPTLAATRDLVLSLVRNFVDRRTSKAKWEGTDRRAPPPVVSLQDEPRATVSAVRS
ncbi:hypothetical protein LZC95_36755 [Pendulispora brunnea]|uniref:DUF2207 domain-containing protein n=1 Tax=Pendulispora brunnea TaxID=2905690 RepID=A0ABZ2K5C7_9BACT